MSHDVELACEGGEPVRASRPENDQAAGARPAQTMPMVTVFVFLCARAVLGAGVVSNFTSAHHAAAGGWARG
jgi:hypothetical protein